MKPGTVDVKKSGRPRGQREVLPQGLPPAELGPIHLEVHPDALQRVYEAFGQIKAFSGDGSPRFTRTVQPPTELPEDLADPWTAKLKVDDIFHLDDPRVQRIFEAMYLQACRGHMEQDGLCLLEGLTRALAWKLPIPDWMAEAFVKRMHKLDEAAGLDALFNYKVATPRVRDSHVERGKKVPIISKLLVKAIFADNSRALDESLYEEVGQQVGISASYCEKLYRVSIREGYQDLTELKALLKGRARTEN